MVNYNNVKCVVCCYGDNEAHLLLCDRCDRGFHIECLNMPRVPDGDWFCAHCVRVRENQKRRKRAGVDSPQPAVTTQSSSSNMMTVFVSVLMILTYVVATKVDVVSCSRMLQENLSDFWSNRGEMFENASNTVQETFREMWSVGGNTTAVVVEAFENASTTVGETFCELWARGQDFYLKYSSATHLAQVVAMPVQSPM